MESNSGKICRRRYLWSLDCFIVLHTLPVSSGYWYWYSSFIDAFFGGFRAMFDLKLNYCLSLLLWQAEGTKDHRVADVLVLVVLVVNLGIRGRE